MSIWDDELRNDRIRKEREEKAKRLMGENNPHNEPVGHFTGRCMKCGSKNLWDDNMHYGCRCCGEIYIC